MFKIYQSKRIQEFPIQIIPHQHYSDQQECEILKKPSQIKVEAVKLENKRHSDQHECGILKKLCRIKVEEVEVVKIIKNEVVEKIPFHISNRRQQLNKAQKKCRTKAKSSIKIKSSVGIFMQPYKEVSSEIVEICGMNLFCLSCGAMMWKLERLSTSTKSTDKFSMCCLQGKIILPLSTPLPKTLQSLLNNNHPQSKDFFNQIRGYNSALAFTSLGVQLDHQLANQKKGVYTFRIHGQIYHSIGSLFPQKGNAPKFAQIYIYDTDHELDNRHNQMKHLDRNLLGELQDMQNKFNPFAQQFKVNIKEQFLNFKYQHRTINYRTLPKN